MKPKNFPARKLIRKIASDSRARTGRTYCAAWLRDEISRDISVIQSITSARQVRSKKYRGGK